MYLSIGTIAALAILAYVAMARIGALEAQLEGLKQAFERQAVRTEGGLAQLNGGKPRIGPTENEWFCPECGEMNRIEDPECEECDFEWEEVHERYMADRL